MPQPREVPVPGADEQPQERGQTVVPVVVAGHREERRLLGRRHRQRGLVGALAPVLVRGVGRRRVHLVAAHHQGLRPGQAVPVDGQLGLRQQVRHRVRGVEAVTQVGHVVEPQPAVRPDLAEDAVAERVLQLALVEVRPEEHRQQRTDAGADQQERRQPRHRLARREAQLQRVGAAWPVGGAFTGRRAVRTLRVGRDSSRSSLTRRSVVPDPIIRCPVSVQMAADVRLVLAGSAGVSRSVGAAGVPYTC